MAADNVKANTVTVAMRRILIVDKPPFEGMIERIIARQVAVNIYKSWLQRHH
jgi:hypothetical protein